MTVPIRRGAACLAVALALVVSGCTSSKKNPGSSSPPGGSSTSAHLPCSGGKPPSSRGGTTATITRVFKVFFDTRTSLADSVAVLQHGSLFCATLNTESNDPAAKNITAKVSAVAMHGANVAKVTFTIYTGKNALLPNTHGFAVRVGGKWQVAAQTFCSLLNLEGTAPPVCKNKAITALPH